jgi:hypothetical protein
MEIKILFKSAISKIAKDTFNTGQNKFAAQFMQSRTNVANYPQCTPAYMGYLVAETVRSGKQQVIWLPYPVNISHIRLSQSEDHQR